MPRKRKNGGSESHLTKGQLRKLNALRKSLGPEIGERAFYAWLYTPASPIAGDKNAQAIDPEDAALTEMLKVLQQ